MIAPYPGRSGEINPPYGRETAVVVLGCALGRSGEIGGAALRRVLCAADVARAHEGLVVLVSGGRRWGGVAEATAMGRRLVAEGVAETRVLRELASLTTRENARYSTPILRGLGISRVVMVTCDFHVPRARACFVREGFDVLAVAAPSPRLRLSRAVYRRVRERIALVLDRLL